VRLCLCGVGLPWLALETGVFFCVCVRGAGVMGEAVGTC